jgi:hypothetical protein
LIWFVSDFLSSRKRAQLDIFVPLKYFSYD